MRTNPDPARSLFTAAKPTPSSSSEWPLDAAAGTLGGC